MLCERCHKNQATTLLTQSVNGHTTVERLCAECAYQSGFTGFFDGFPFGQVMEKLAHSKQESGKRCPGCGASLDEIVSSGRIGCAECYRTFRAELMPTIQNIHGKAEHVGKRPQRTPPRPAVPLIAQLREELRLAVESEHYEQAAELRDKIKGLSQQEPDKGDA